MTTPRNTSDAAAHLQVRPEHTALRHDKRTPNTPITTHVRRYHFKLQRVVLCRNIWCCVRRHRAHDVADSEQRRRFFRLHWLPYVLPRAPPWFWDWLHSKQPGGLWKYNANVQTEPTSFVLRTQPDYKSLLDVACNGGFMLQRLQKQRPKAKHYGTDISPAMVAATRSRCTECAGVAVYDLATLVIDEKAARSAGNVSIITDEQGSVLPPSFDVVIVSDVLFFMPWAGLPPAANRFVPTSWLRASQKRLFDALTRMAKRVVVFSDHENNPYVVDFLQAMGAVRRPMVTLHGRKQRSVWTAAGRAP